MFYLSMILKIFLLFHLFLWTVSFYCPTNVGIKEPPVKPEKGKNNPERGNTKEKRQESNIGRARAIRGVRASHAGETLEI